MPSPGFTANEKGGPGVSHGVPSEDDMVVVAVMGCTGTGKSSFIKLLTGDATIEVGHKLRSQTSDIQVNSFQDPATGRRVTIVDTPGFDDSRPHFTDTEVLKKISEFLVNEYKGNRKLSGLVYLTRISDPRFGGQSNRNLNMLKSLCGAKTFKNIVVLTTFWDHVSEEQGAEREAELKESFFSSLVAGGARFMRHDCTIDSAHRVLAHISTLAPRHVRIQDEIVVEGKKLEETEAGSIRREELTMLIEKHKAEVDELRKAVDDLAQSSAIAKLELALEREKARNLLSQWERERSELAKGLDLEKQARKEQEADFRRQIEELHRRLAEEAETRRREEAQRAEEARKHQDALLRKQVEELQRSLTEEKESRRRQEAQRAEQVRKRQEARRLSEMREQKGVENEKRTAAKNGVDIAPKLPESEATPAEEDSGGWCLLQ